MHTGQETHRAAGMTFDGALGQATATCTFNLGLRFSMLSWRNPPGFMCMMHAGHVHAQISMMACSAAEKV